MSKHDPKWDAYPIFGVKLRPRGVICGEPLAANGKAEKLEPQGMRYLYY